LLRVCRTAVGSISFIAGEMIRTKDIHSRCEARANDLNLGQLIATLQD